MQITTVVNDQYDLKKDILWKQRIHQRTESLETVIIFHFEGMSFSSAHDLKQWDFLDNNEIFSEFAQFIRQHILTILTIKQLVVKRPSLTRCAQT